MPAPPRRARFQVHLSTAIALMFTAGGLIWGNTIERTMLIQSDLNSLEIGQRSEIKYFGWPFPAIAKEIRAPERPNDGAVSIVCGERSQGLGVPLNILVGAFLLFFVWYACEWLIRRRALKKGP